LPSLVFLGGLFLCLSGIYSSLYAQGDVSETWLAAGLTGSTQIALGAEIQIYSIGLSDGFPLPQVNDLGHNTVVANKGIQITISDLTVPTGLAPTDFTELRLYRSADRVFDAGDALMVTEATVNIGAVTELNVTDNLPLGHVDRRLDPGGAEAVFFITAVISPTAVAGHSFRVGAAPFHVGLYENPGNGDYLQSPAGIIASDANHMVLGAQTASTSAQLGGAIPFGGEGAILVLLVGSGLYMIRRHTR